MGEPSPQNPALRFSEVLRNWIGRLGLSTGTTGSFAAVAGTEEGATEAPRPNGYTAIPDREQSASFGIFGSAEPDPHPEVTASQEADIAAAIAATET